MENQMIDEKTLTAAMSIIISAGMPGCCAGTP